MHARPFLSAPSPSGFTWKMALVVNTSVRMGKGKVAAQVAHAAVTGVAAAPRGAVSAWTSVGSPKIVLRCSGEPALLALAGAARAAHLPVAVVRVEGPPQVEPGTLTAVAVGPGEAAAVDAVTGGLQLL